MYDMGLIGAPSIEEFLNTKLKLQTAGAYLGAFYIGLRAQLQVVAQSHEHPSRCSVGHCIQHEICGFERVRAWRAWRVSVSRSPKPTGIRIRSLPSSSRLLGLHLTPRPKKAAEGWCSGR